MSETYTFTARSAEDARHVATFTLFDHQMAIDSGEPLVDAGLIFDDDDDLGTGSVVLGADLAQGLRQWAQPVGSWLFQRAVQPFEINDVKASAADNGLDVRAWVRTGGRRLAPLVFR